MMALINTEAFFHQLAQASQVPALSELSLRDTFRVPPETLCNAIARFKVSSKFLSLMKCVMSDDGLRNLFKLLVAERLPMLEATTVADFSRLFFYPLRLRQDVLQHCVGRFDFTLRYFTGAGMPFGLCALADNPTYSVPGSPGRMDMKQYTGDSVGHIVDEALLLDSEGASLENEDLHLSDL
ncbi:hypothetical protein JX266_013904 [Neoarthrinium moseri]|nr:hypothetical protein JX266_013904 [Neoarthrinium moseri]